MEYSLIVLYSAEVGAVSDAKKFFVKGLEPDIIAMMSLVASGVQVAGSITMRLTDVQTDKYVEVGETNCGNLRVKFANMITLLKSM